MLSEPDRVRVHPHDQLVERPSKLRAKLGLLLKGLFSIGGRISERATPGPPGEVEDVLPRDVVVDDGHTVMVAHEGSHGSSGPVREHGATKLCSKWKLMA